MDPRAFSGPCLVSSVIPGLSALIHPVFVVLVIGSVERSVFDGEVHRSPDEADEFAGDGGRGDLR